MDALCIRLQPFYMGDPIGTPKGEDYVRGMCKRVCNISRTLGALGRRRLYDLKDRFDSDQTSLHSFNPPRASKATALAFIKEFIKVNMNARGLAIC